MSDPANALINESSPYLLQHARNPVNWHPWGKEALQRAREEGKLMIISIGYAACHWCHVMEHESFEDMTVAQVMNRNFVSIKVDREERPDIDAIYMNAALLINGQGGWPLNAIALPDGRPVYALTYMPKENWIKLLEYFQQLYEHDRQKLEDQAKNITEGIHKIENIAFRDSAAHFTEQELDQVFRNISQSIDYTKGGKSGAPKFPMPNIFDFLLRHYYFTQDATALKAVTVTLENMTNGGIYDHIGGGFARYATDPVWLVPHFEKMLYDNGQLMSLYADAYRVTHNPQYKQVVEETLRFIEREMTSPDGGFYSSLDADSEGEEGKYYVWTKKEIDDILGEDSGLLKALYNIETSGNWEDGKNIPHITRNISHLAEKYDIPEQELRARIAKQKQQLLQVREQRVKPGLDDKILTSWNALMLKGYVDAYIAFKDEKYISAALRNAEFLSQNALQDDFRLTRNHKNGKSSINGFLDDYSFTIEAFIALYQATFEIQWLQKAEGLAKYALEHFYDNKSGMFFYTSDQDDPLIARKMEVSDNVIPASNSSMAKALLQLGHFFDNNKYISTAEQMMVNMQEMLRQQPLFYSNWAILLQYLAHQPYEIAVVGEESRSKKAAMDKRYIPNAIFLGSDKEENLPLLQGKYIAEKTVIYVCRDKTCQLPVTEVSEALEQVK